MSPQAPKLNKDGWEKLDLAVKEVSLLVFFNEFGNHPYDSIKNVSGERMGGLRLLP